MVLSACYFLLHGSQASGDKLAAAFDPQTSEAHYINIPYFSESDRMSSTLTLNNNESEPMTASVTIFSKKGDQITVPPITLQPTLAARFGLKDLIGNARGDFNSGNIQVFYHGSSMAITSQVSIVSANHHLAFESVETEAMDFASTTLNGIAWIPNDETRASVALTNTTSDPLDVTAMGNQKVQSMTLKARETRVINLEEYLGNSHATLITLEHHGPLGALIATGFALNEETGFSTNLNFVDCTTAKASRLAAAHVRFGQADPQEGFPAGTNFRTPLVIANTMDMPTEARISITYTLDSVTNTVQLKPITLAAREVKQIELAQQMARLGVGPVDDAGADITYTHMPGTVIGRLTSYDASGDYSFDVPVKDPVGQGNGGYPWRLDNGYTTVVHLKNTLDKEVTALVQLRYEGGSYNPNRIKLAPYQTVAIDIRKLRDAQQKDIRGGVMPTNVESGQIAWFEEEVGSLIGRAEVANQEAAMASSFSCGECICGGLVYDSCAMTPPSGEAEVGQFGYMFAPSVMKRDCHYVQYGPYSPTSAINWSSTNTTVVTVDGSGIETAVAPGSAYILARFSEIGGYNYSCAAIYANITTSATCGVQCTTPTGETTAFGGWADSDNLPTVAKWNQTLTPASTSFAGRTVTERDPGGSGPDTCYFNGSAFAPQTSISGGTWSVDANNQWGSDYVGWTPGAVTYYRDQGRAPCGTFITQRMVIDCVTGEQTYSITFPSLELDIQPLLVISRRAEGQASRTWP